MRRTALAVCLLAATVARAEPWDEDGIPPEPRDGPAIDRSWVSLQAGVGVFTAVKLGVFLAPPGKVRLEVEGMRGSLLFDAAYGGGLRAQIEAVQGRQGRNAMLVSPGMQYWVVPANRDAGWFSVPTELHELVFNVELSWLHRFPVGLGLELGIRGGIVSGDDTGGSRLVLPDLALFTGLRF